MTSCTDSQSTYFGMGTVMTHKAYGRYAEESLTAVSETSAQLEGLLSRFMPGSEISKINRSAGIQCEMMSGDTYEVLSRAVEFSRRCKGLFDVTIGPLVTLWNDGKTRLQPPDRSRIEEILPLVDYADLVLDPCQNVAGLQRTRQSIDLGGIGKGYAGDRFMEVFRRFGISSAFTNIGGNVVTLGTKPDGRPWRVGIQHPRREDGLLGLVSVSDKAVVTSGDYHRYFQGDKGKRHHHILDPSTGHPSESGLVSVTVVADSSTDADALSTMMHVAGLAKARDLLRAFPGAEAVLVDADLHVYVTAGLIDCFEAADDIDASILY